MPQGELQASLSALRTIVSSPFSTNRPRRAHDGPQVTIVTPMLWARIYAFGVTMNVPSLFYYVSAAAGVVQLILLQRLVSAPDPEQPAPVTKEEAE